MCLRPVVHLIKETNHGIGQKSLANKYLAQEEVFGPVLGVLTFHEEELIALANQRCNLSRPFEASIPRIKEDAMPADLGECL